MITQMKLSKNFSDHYLRGIGNQWKSMRGIGFIFDMFIHSFYYKCHKIYSPD